jgi:CRISPR-associated protein Cmr2
MDIEQWRIHVLEPLRKGELPTADVDALGGLALLAADTDRTQDYVFESAKLPEVRGASCQLDDLNLGSTVALFRDCGLSGRFVDDAPPGEIVYAGGGGLLALVPEEKAGALAQAIEAEYPKVTDVATITADWRPVTPEMVLNGYPDGGFGGLARWAGNWLRRRKEDKSPGPFFEALPHAVRCRSCHIRPADHYVSLGDWPLCQVCKNKRIYEGRRAWFRHFQQFLTDHSALTQQYYTRREPFPPFPAPDEEDYAPPRQLPQDLSELGQASQGRRGYVGLIYLDGDGLGDLFYELTKMSCYRDFSKQIQQTLKHAVMSALAAYLHPARVRASEARAEVGEKPAPGEWVWIHPFEIITIGGDDVWLIVPGDAALPIAAAVSTAFSNKAPPRPDNGEPCTLSGGVVIADDHNPVRVLRDLAKDLAREAKRARQGTDVDTGYIDFHIFKSADMLDRKLSTLRQTYPYTLPAGEKSLRLLGRPYPSDVLTGLWLALQELRKNDFPTSQMHQLAEALLLGRHRSSLFYEYQRVRDTEDHFVRLDAALTVAQGNREIDPTPWRKLCDDRYSHQTALWDIAEVYEFVSRT